MKIGAYRHGGRTWVGQLADDERTLRPFDLPDTALADGAAAVLDILAAGAEPRLLDRMDAVADVTLLAPIPRPRRNILCVGKNYHDHAHEFARSGFDSSAGAGGQDALPDAPIIFSKVPECVIGPTAPILIDPAVSTAIDYEAELAVVIGKGGRGIRPEDALSHVFGYTIVNDVTARDLQKVHKQWLLGKSQDTFCPMGPWVVTADSLDPTNLQVRCWVNGELRQDASTRALIFDIPTLIATISRGVTLRPGDIIATGTPAGVGIGFDPPRYLKVSDSVRVAITGIGELNNPVQDWSTSDKHREHAA